MADYKKLCKKCKVRFIQPCPFATMYQSRGYSPQVGSAECPSCYYERVSAEQALYDASPPSTDAARAPGIVSHCVNNVTVCQRCPSHTRCMTMTIGV